MNTVNEELKKNYNNWICGQQYLADKDYSNMFQMGVPEEYISREKPLIMYVGQECKNCSSYKTQTWCEAFLRIQMTKQPDRNEAFERVLNSPFWNFARLVSETCTANIIWNNLDKFHRLNPEQPVYSEDAIRLNAPYGKEKLSILQREIQCVNPDMLLFCIGPRKKYGQSLAAAFDCQWTDLEPYRPTKNDPLHRIDPILGLSIPAYWTYHPAFLCRAGLQEPVVLGLAQAIR